MFAGANGTSLSPVQEMQLFHEIKPKFPTVPDYIVTSCIRKHGRSDKEKICQVLNAVLEKQMGRATQQPPITTCPPATTSNISTNENTTEPHPDLQTKPNQSPPEPNRKADLSSERAAASEMNEPLHHVPAKKSSSSNESKIKRPDNLDLNGSRRADRSSDDRLTGFFKSNNIRPSSKCTNVPELLKGSDLSNKPPKSPQSAKRPGKNSPTKPEPKKTTVSTPTQTTDTLNGPVTIPGVTTSSHGAAASAAPGASVNFNVNVNCSLVQSPVKHRSVMQMTPKQPWLADQSEVLSPGRSYNSVNFVIRPPSSDHQPIDITSQNSSLTYSTSSFDSKNGLQSSLQITVGPSGSSVSSRRSRPSSYVGAATPDNGAQDLLPTRAGSLNDLADNNDSPVVLRQQIRIDKMRIELESAKIQFTALRNEVQELEKEVKDDGDDADDKLSDEYEKQLIKEVNHLKVQCEQLSLEQKEIFSQFQRDALPSRGANGSRRPFPDITIFSQPFVDPVSPDNEKWNCQMCTFLNHPEIRTCECCGMLRALHGTANFVGTASINVLNGNNNNNDNSNSNNNKSLSEAIAKLKI